jgi:hypothetical protein
VKRQDEVKDHASGHEQPKTKREANAVADDGSCDERQKNPVAVCNNDHV